MAQQTAVGWLTDQIKEHKKKFGIPPTEKGYMNLIEQAKQIEKEQIMNAANTLLYRGTGPSDMWAEQYYNETYNK